MLAEQHAHFARLGKAALLLLRENDLAVDDDVELALGALLGDGLVLSLVVQLGRETRGPFVITVSDGAVEDADPRHAHTLAIAALGRLVRRPCHNYSDCGIVMTLWLGHSSLFKRPLNALASVRGGSARLSVPSGSVRSVLVRATSLMPKI